MDPYSIGSESGSEESTDEERFQRPSYSSDDEERRKSTKRKAPTKKASKKSAPKRPPRKADEQSMMCKDVLGLDNLPFWCQCAHKKFCMRDRWWTQTEWNSFIQRCKAIDSFVPVTQARWLHVAIQTLEFHRNHEWKGERGQQFYEIYQQYQQLRKIKLKVDDSDLYPKDANVGSSKKKRRKQAAPSASSSPDPVSPVVTNTTTTTSTPFHASYFNYDYQMSQQARRQQQLYHHPPQPAYHFQPLQVAVAAEMPLIPSPIHAAQSLLTLAQPQLAQYPPSPSNTNLQRISVAALIN